MALTIDEGDPCAAAATLRDVYRNIIAGQAALTISFTAGLSGVSRSVTFNAANPALLQSEIRRFEGLCAALTNQRPRHFSMRAGGI